MAGSINSHCETQVAAVTTGQWAQLTSPQVRRRACTDVSFHSALRSLRKLLLAAAAYALQLCRG